MKLCKDKFNVPVAESANVQNAAVVTFWRAKEKFVCQGNIMMGKR